MVKYYPLYVIQNLSYLNIIIFPVPRIKGACCISQKPGGGGVVIVRVTSFQQLFSYSGPETGGPCVAQNKDDIKLILIDHCSTFVLLNPYRYRSYITIRQV